MTTGLCLTSARLIDGTGTAPLEGATVTINDGRIAGVETDPGPSGVPRLDLGGRTLMPGLVDAHFHVTGFDMPVFPKRRFQHGALPADAMRSRLGGTEQTYRRAFHGLYLDADQTDYYTRVLAFLAAHTQKR